MSLSDALNTVSAAQYVGLARRGGRVALLASKAEVPVRHGLPERDCLTLSFDAKTCEQD
jgi:hypothetical protein